MDIAVAGVRPGEPVARQARPDTRPGAAARGRRPSPAQILAAETGVSARALARAPAAPGAAPKVVPTGGRALRGSGHRPVLEAAPSMAQGTARAVDRGAGVNPGRRPA